MDSDKSTDLIEKTFYNNRFSKVITSRFSNFR